MIMTFLLIMNLNWPALAYGAASVNEAEGEEVVAASVQPEGTSEVAPAPEPEPLADTTEETEPADVPSDDGSAAVAQDDSEALPDADDSTTGDEAVPDDEAAFATEGEVVAPESADPEAVVDGEPEAEVEDEESFPAQTLTARVGSISVKIEAPEGALPEGAQVVAKRVNDSSVEDAVEAKVESQDRVVEDMVAIDVTIRDKDGNEIQPRIPVSVRFSNTNLDSPDVSVYHVDDANNVTEVRTDVATANVQQFDADGFSIYVVVGEGEIEPNSRLEVVFVQADGTRVSIFVKQGDDLDDILYDPGVGELDSNVSFRGWTADENYTAETTSLTVTGVREEVQALLDTAPGVAEGDSITYYPMLFKNYTVSYLDESGTSLGVETVEFRADSDASNHTYTVNMAYTPKDDEHGFQGWVVATGSVTAVDPDDPNVHVVTEEGEGGTVTEQTYYSNGAVVTLTGDVTFSVRAPEGHWLIFNENGKGATYNAPRFIEAGDVTERPCLDSAMTRLGYTFGGWYADAACTQPFTFGNTLSDNTTVYAKWNPVQTATYTVIIWRQNVAGDGYDFEQSIQLTGTTGSAINTVQPQSSGNSRYARINGTNYQYTGFHLDRYDTGVSVNPEGNSVVNVYYDRNEYTLTFQEYGYTYTPATGTNGTQYGYYNGEYVRIYYNNGTWYRTRTGGGWGGYSYSNPYSGPRYTRSNNQS